MKRTITIDKKLTQFSDTIEYFTKTESSNSVIPFPNVIYDLLVDIRNDQHRHHKYFKDSYFVFGGLVPVNYHNYRYNFKQAFPDYTLHDLRHAYASYLHSKGTDYNVLKDLLRHSTITTTINTYTHNYDESTQDAMDLLDDHKR